MLVVSSPGCRIEETRYWLLGVQGSSQVNNFKSVTRAQHGSMVLKRACYRHMPLPGTSPFREGSQSPGELFGALHVSRWAVCHLRVQVGTPESADKRVLDPVIEEIHDVLLRSHRRAARPELGRRLRRGAYQVGNGVCGCWPLLSLRDSQDMALAER